ncbi:MAG: preprotein translocase subunit SecG [Hyphomicrobiaceae bacterium]
MQTVLLLLHLMIAAALVGVVLLQRSEGGGLGIGGGGGSFMTGRGTANLLTRVTAGLAAAFFVTSISLTLLARHTARPLSPLDAPVSGSSSGQSAPAKGGVLDSLEKGKQRLPSIPKSD